MFEEINRFGGYPDYKGKRIYYIVYNNTIKDWLQFVKDVEETDYTINFISTSDSKADIGLKLGGGDYDVNTFLNNYEKCVKYCDELGIYLNENDISIVVSNSDHNIVFGSDDSELTLNDIFTQKKRL